jgi:hypothetical protein
MNCLVVCADLALSLNSENEDLRHRQKEPNPIGIQRFLRMGTAFDGKRFQSGEAQHRGLPPG